MKKFFVKNPYVVGISIIFAILILYFLPIDILDYLERKTLDLRFEFSKQVIPSEEIVIVTIDNKSEDYIGRWPWPRDCFGKVLDNLYDWGSAIVGIDVIFSEKEKDPVRKILTEKDAEKYAAAGLIKDNDKVLASAIENAGNVVLGFYFFTEQEEGSAHYTQEQRKKFRGSIFNALVPMIDEKGEGEEKFDIRRGYDGEVSIEQIADVCRNQGFLNIFPDKDGTLRKTAFVMKNEDDWYAAFPLQILKNYLKEGNVALTVSDYGISSLSIGDYPIPVDGNGEVLIDHSIDFDSFKSFSFVDVMNGTVNPSEFKNRIVLIGITDPGLIRDSWPTPGDVVTLGIYIHARTIDTVLHNRFFAYSGKIELINLLAIIILGLILTLAVPKLPRAAHGAMLLFLYSCYIHLPVFIYSSICTFGLIWFILLHL